MSAAQQFRIYFLLQRAAHRLKKSADRSLMNSGGITTAQAAVLAVLAKDKQVRQRDIAAALGLRESAITAMTRRLIEAGLISKRRSRADARAYDLSLSDKGRSALSSIEESFLDTNQIIDECFRDEDIEALASSLKRLIERVD